MKLYLGRLTLFSFPTNNPTSMYPPHRPGMRVSVFHLYPTQKSWRRDDQRGPYPHLNKSRPLSITTSSLSAVTQNMYRNAAFTSVILQDINGLWVEWSPGRSPPLVEAFTEEHEGTVKAAGRRCYIFI